MILDQDSNRLDARAAEADRQFQSKVCLRSTKFFHDLVKRKSKRNTIVAVAKASGE